MISHWQPYDTITWSKQVGFAVVYWERYVAKSLEIGSQSWDMRDKTPHWRHWFTTVLREKWELKAHVENCTDLCERSDWSTHRLIGHLDEAHGDLLHRHCCPPTVCSCLGSSEFIYLQSQACKGELYKHKYSIVNRVQDPFLLLLMVSSSLYVSHMFVTRVLLSLIFRVVLL